jgi:hypothetical protein
MKGPIKKLKGSKEGKIKIPKDGFMVFKTSGEANPIVPSTKNTIAK